MGEAYLAARKAALEVSGGSQGHPWAWRRAIERWHRANGQDHARTLTAIGQGQFRALQTTAGLRTALDDAQRSRRG